MNLGKKLVVFDVETTTKDEKTGCIIQIGAVKLAQDFSFLSKFSIYVQPFRDAWAQESENCHRITRDFLKENGSAPLTALQKFESWLGENPNNFYLSYWSAGFDVRMLQSLYDFCGLKYAYNRRSFDIASVARIYLSANDWLQSSPHKVGLSHCAESLGIEHDKDRMHDALYDSLLTTAVLKELLTRFKSCNIQKTQ